MKILFCSRRFFPAISGMSVYALNLLRELVAAGHDVTMVSQYRGDEAGTRVYGGGPPPAVPGVRILGRRSLGEEHGGDFERDVEDMVDTILESHAETPFDVLHAQYGYPNGWAVLLAARRIGVPTIVSIQGGDGHWVGSCCETHRRAMVEVIQHANAVLIGCESFAQEVVNRLHVPRERFTLVPGAVDTQRFAPERGWRAGHAETPPRLLYHGRVDRRKGALDLLDALASLRERGVTFRTTYSGIGPDFEASRTKAAELNLDVAFTGYADYDAAPAAYHGQDIFASPTHAEGFSNTILEAMASGLPIASCRAVGVMDCLRDGENGLLSDPGDIEGLARNLHALATDAALRERLASVALEEVRRVYSWPAVAARIMRVYEEVAGAKPSLGFDPVLEVDRACRFRAAPHLL
jgi:glycosyltransferase involved in cell wall biosynthesis